MAGSNPIALTLLALLAMGPLAAHRFHFETLEGDIGEAPCTTDLDDPYLLITSCQSIVSTSPSYYADIDAAADFLEDVTPNKDQATGVAFERSDMHGFPSDFFEDFDIAILIFIENNFETFPNELIMHVSPNLRGFYMISNSITLFDTATFLHKLPFAGSLWDLILINCNIMSIESHSFDQFSSLQLLELPDNLLTEIPRRAFAKSHLLTTINLSNNKITTLHQQSFYDLPNLITVDLSNNVLLTIDAGTFEKLGRLTSIDLSNNWIWHIEETAFNDEDQPKLVDLKVKKNQLFCDCNLQWFKQWLNNRGIMKQSGATCIYPRRRPFEDIEFCPASIAKSNITLSLS